MRIIVVLILTGILLITINISAQKYASENIWEIGGSISYTNTTAVTDGEASDHLIYKAFSLEIPAYYFVIKNLELGFIPAYQYSDDHGNISSGYSLFFGTAYHFPANAYTFLFFEGRIGYNAASIYSKDSSGMVWMVIGGVKVRVGGSTLVNLGVGYTQSTMANGGSDDGRRGANILSIKAGLAIFI